MGMWWGLDFFPLCPVTPRQGGSIINLRGRLGPGWERRKAGIMEPTLGYARGVAQKVREA